MGQPRAETGLGPAGFAAAAVRFASALRSAGLPADLGAVIGFARALGLIDLGRPDELRAAGAAFFVDRPENRRPYDVTFDRFWLRGDLRVMPEQSHGGADSAGRSSDGSSPTDEMDAAAGAGGQEGVEVPADMGDGPSLDQAAPTAELSYSAAEALRHKAFDRMTPDELHDALRLIAELRPRIPQRHTRRYEIHDRGRLLAPRAMLRRSLATGGEPLTWRWRRRRRRPRSIAVLCDISGSMEQHSRFVLRFVHTLRRLDVRTEAFVFGTRLTRITPHLRHRDADRALADVASAVRDWAGGTQIGGALRTFNRHWARRVVRSSSIVIIVSDGWDRGDARVVAEEMRRLARRCHRLVWLNPLAATTDYEPRTAGMAAAYPYIDTFLPIGTVDNLEELSRALGAARGWRPARARG